MRIEPPSGDEMDRLLSAMKRKVMDGAGRTRPAKRTRIDRIVGGAMAAVLLLGLGSAGAAFALGIFHPESATDTDAAPIATPTATAPAVRSFPVATAPPPVTIDGPTPRIDLRCDDVIDTAALISFLGDAGSTIVGPDSSIDVPSPNASTTPERAAAEQLGALSCRWSDESGPDFPSAGGQEVVLSVLPEGVDAAERYVELYNIADSTYGPHVQGPRCVADSGYCELYGVVGATWVEFRVDGIISDGMSDEELRTAFRGITDPLVDSITAATVQERWTPSSPSPTASATCADVAPTAAIAALLDVPDLDIGERWDGPRASQFWYAKDEVHAHRCSFAFTTSDATMGGISILPNGAWAVDRYGDGWSTHGRIIPLTAAADGMAISRCEDSAQVCRLDFVVDDDWVSVSVVPVAVAHDGSPVTAERVDTARSHMVEIATIVAERISELSK